MKIEEYFPPSINMLAAGIEGEIDAWTPDLESKILKKEEKTENSNHGTLIIDFKGVKS